MDFGQRLKNLRLERGYNQQQFANAVGASVVAVRNWEYNIKKPTMDMLLSIAKILQVSLDTLLDFAVAGQTKSLVLSTAENALIKNYRLLDTHGQKAVETICSLEKERIEAAQKKSKPNVIEFKSAKTSERFIPRYTTPAAAGYSVPLDGTDFEMLLVDDSVPPLADYAVDIQGDSMAPYIEDGDMVYVQKDGELSIGDIGIFCVDGAMYCKQYYIDDERNLILVSANPRLRHSNVFVAADSGSSVTVCGKVLLGCRIKLPDYIYEDEDED